MKHVAILVDPDGKEHYEAYGPMVQDREKATHFDDPIVAMRCANNRFGRGEQGFWNSERAHFAQAKERFRGWTCRVEEAEEALATAA